MNVKKIMLLVGALVIAAVTAIMAKNKHRMRETLSLSGIQVPRFWHFSLDEDPRDVAGRVLPHARVVVVEDVGAAVLRVGLAADAHVAGTQVAAGVVGRRRRRRRAQLLTRPRAGLPMRRDDHPFLAQRMPALFPHCRTDVIATPTVGARLRAPLGSRPM